MSGEISKRSGHTITSNIVNGGRVHFGDHFENITYNINYDVYSQHSLDVGAGERIGVLASLPGLLGITGAIHQQLKAFADVQGTNTTRLYYDASASVAACRLTLESFRRRLTLLDLSSERAALVKVDKLVILFAHAILLFEELAVVLKQSSGVGGKRLDTEQLSAILGRVREQNYAWGLQDFILSSPDDEAARSTVPLLDKVSNKLLAGQDDLRRRISDFQDHVQECIERSESIEQAHGEVPQHPIYSERPGPSTGVNRLSMTPAEFEQALSESWVYRRNRDRITSLSFRDSISFGWSELSELSLGDVSVISVVALPIRVSELQYGHWYVAMNETSTAATEDTSRNKLKGPSHETLQIAQRQSWSSAHSKDSEEGVDDELHFAHNWPSGTLNAHRHLPSLSHRTSSSPTVDDLDLARTWLSTAQNVQRHLSAPSDPENSTPASAPSAFHTQKNVSNGSEDLPVLFVCASLFEFSIDRSRREAGYPYLQYVQGEVFDVVAQKGELWLARNEDDVTNQLGWIWEQHFVRLSQEDDDTTSRPVHSAKEDMQKGCALSLAAPQ